MNGALPLKIKKRIFIELPYKLCLVCIDNVEEAECIEKLKILPVSSKKIFLCLTFAITNIWGVEARRTYIFVLDKYIKLIYHSMYQLDIWREV